MFISLNSYWPSLSVEMTHALPETETKHVLLLGGAVCVSPRRPGTAPGARQQTLAWQRPRRASGKHGAQVTQTLQSSVPFHKSVATVKVAILAEWRLFSQERKYDQFSETSADNTISTECQRQRQQFFISK